MTDLEKKPTTDLVPHGDAETVVVDPGELGGPVDPPDEPRTLYGTIVDEQAGERRPIVPAWLRNRDQRVAFLLYFLDRIWYFARLHAWHSPVYLGKVAVFGVWGALRLLGRQFRWWWHPELFSMLQQAASTKGLDAVRTGVLVNNKLGDARAFRGGVLLAELVGIVIGVFVAIKTVPTWAQVAAGAAALLVLARFGKPAGKTILERTTSGPRFTKLTAEVVRVALCSIGIPGIKEPSQVSFPPPGIHRDGPGWLARVNLPQGVEAVDVLERRGRLSSAMRLPVDQVWPSSGPDHAGQLDLWVGYLPASKMGQPKWSLAAANARTSIFDLIEFGTDERMRPVKTVLFARNFLIGGVPGSGKSYGARALVTGALLDPTCELKILEYKGTGDFGDMAHLCTTYACGVTDTEFAMGLEVLNWGLREAERRGERIRKAKERGEAPEGKVTPELAARHGSGLHPVVILIDEAHELFGDSTVGKEAAVAAERLIKRGRALGIIVILATQIPDKSSLPPNITRCVTVRWCMAVQDQIANDMILGTGAYKRGLAATVYRPGDDAGWGIAIGLRKPGPVRSHFPDPKVTASIIARATDLRGGVVGGVDDVLESRDVLGDIRAVFGADRRLHWETIANRLAEQLPDAYPAITAEVVSAHARAFGIPSEDVKVAGRTRKGAKVEEIDAARERRQELVGG